MNLTSELLSKRFSSAGELTTFVNERKCWGGPEGAAFEVISITCCDWVYTLFYTEW